MYTEINKHKNSTKHSLFSGHVPYSQSNSSFPLRVAGRFDALSLQTENSGVQTPKTTEGSASGNNT
jgi:hypothetical protein